jgi:hypothetical protein
MEDKIKEIETILIMFWKRGDITSVNSIARQISQLLSPKQPISEEETIWRLKADINHFVHQAQEGKYKSIDATEKIISRFLSLNQEDAISFAEWKEDYTVLVRSNPRLYDYRAELYFAGEKLTNKELYTGPYQEYLKTIKNKER